MADAGLADARTPYAGSRPMSTRRQLLKSAILSIWYGDKAGHQEHHDRNSRHGQSQRSSARAVAANPPFLRALNRMHELVPHARIEGEVLVERREHLRVRHRSGHVRRRVGMVFQKSNPFPTMSIARERHRRPAPQRRRGTARFSTNASRNPSAWPRSGTK